MHTTVIARVGVAMMVHPNLMGPEVVLPHLLLCLHPYPPKKGEVTHRVWLPLGGGKWTPSFHPKVPP